MAFCDFDPERELLKSHSTWSDHLIAEAERQINTNPGPCADFMRILVKEYRIAVDQALRLEDIIHEATK